MQCAICTKKASAVKCTNCKLPYCSAVCKKAHRKHKCQFVPTDDSLQLVKGPQTPVLDFIPIKTERTAGMMYLPDRLRGLIYPAPDGVGSVFDKSANPPVRVITHPDGTIEPRMEDGRATYLFGTLFEKNREKIIIGDKTKGYLTAEYKNYIEFAEACLVGDISAITWKDDSSLDSEYAVNAIRTMDKHGRAAGVLFGRLRIGKNGVHLSTCVRLDIVKLPENNVGLDSNNMIRIPTNDPIIFSQQLM